LRKGWSSGVVLAHTPFLFHLLSLRAYSDATNMNPNATHPTSPKSLVRSVLENKNLILQLSLREILGRYKGSALGLVWSFFNPVLMLFVYTFVFSEIFKSRWVGGADESRTAFAFILFVGMIILNFFCEVLNRSPLIILGNVNYVKKVVFPIETLPMVLVITAIFHAAVSIGVLLLAMLFFNSHLPWTTIFFPIVLTPLVVLALGLSWILSSLGVFVRDVGQTISIVTMTLMFLSPVFYPISSVPAAFRDLLLLNPLTFIIEQSRDVLIWGKPPDWVGLIAYLFVSMLIAHAGYVWFQKTRKGFADVL
jgi:lipopolysaccharide transport system permease protein